MSIRMIPENIRNRILKDHGFAVEQIPAYKAGDVPTHYVPLVYQCSSMAGTVGDALFTIAQYAASLPVEQRAKTFRYDVAPTSAMRDGNETDRGFGDGKLLLVHSDVVGALIAQGKLKRDDLDKGVTCAFVPGKPVAEKDPDACYHIKGFASRLADKPAAPRVR